MAKKTTLDAVKKFAESFQAVIDLANEAEPLGDVNQALDDANKQLAELNAQISVAQGKYEDLKASFGDVEDTAKIEAEKIISDAKLKAEGIIAEAKAKAEQDKIDTANVSDAMLTQVRAELEELHKSKADAHEELEALKAQHEEIKAAKKGAEDSLNELRSKRDSLVKELTQGAENG